MFSLFGNNKTNRIFAFKFVKIIMVITKEMIDLFQDFCAHHETVYNFSPLTAQIYTYIMFNNNKDGVTFEELVEKLHASKSSVSTSLNLLISLNKIEHFNKIDERKRFFRLTPNYIINRLELIKNLLQKEYSLTLRLKSLDGCKIVGTSNFEEKSQVYIEHLEKSSKQLTETIHKLKSINQ